MLLDPSLVLESYLFGDIDFVFNNVMLFIIYQNILYVEIIIFISN